MVKTTCLCGCLNNLEKIDIVLDSLYLLPQEEQNLDLQVLGTIRFLWQVGHSYSE